MAPPLDGRLDADVAVDWKPGDGAPRLVVDARRLALSALRLGDAKAPDAAAERIELTSARVDTAARSLAIGRLALQAPRLRLERDAEQRWSFERWQTATAAVGGRRGGAGGGGIACIGRVGRLGGAERQGLDRRPAHARHRQGPRRLRRPLAGGARSGLDVTDLSLQLDRYALDAKAAAPFRLRARVAVPAGPTGAAVGSGFAGSVDARGELSAIAGGCRAGAAAPSSC